MLEGLPPNNATHLLRLVTDERRARAVADLRWSRRRYTSTKTITASA